jgi:cytochrome oxidase Cu insertion factor (SCO1/SenC/PrrC family)
MTIASALLAAALIVPAPTATPWVPMLQVGQSVPVDQVFVDQGGRTFRWSQLRGRSVVLAFMHTRCRDANECAATSAKFAAMQGELPRGSRLLEVSLDPAYDTPAVLHDYGEMFGQDPRHWTLATGNPPSVLQFVRRFIEVSPGRDPADREHGEVLAIFDRQQKLASLTPGTDWEPDEALAEVRQTLGEASNPFDRLKLWSRKIGAAFRRVEALCGGALAGVDTGTLVDARGVDARAVVASPNPWPTPRITAPNAAPRILALWMNETSIPSGSNWYGRAITSTNVASLEIRTESFSFVAERPTFGNFRFSQHMLDMVPYYKRPYQLYVIARNAAGDRDEWLVPIEFR